MSRVVFEFDSDDGIVLKALVGALKIMRDNQIDDLINQAEHDCVCEQPPAPTTAELTDDAPANDDQPEIDVTAALGAQPNPMTEGVSDTVAQQQSTTVGDAPEVDKMGIPWDSRIHAGTKNKRADGVWKRKKGIDDSVYDSVVAELKAIVGGAPTTVEQPPAPTTVEQPPAPTTVEQPPAPTTVEQPPAPTTVATGAVTTFPQLIEGIMVLKAKHGDAVNTEVLKVIREYNCDALPKVQHIPQSIPEIFAKLETACLLLG